MKFHIHIFYNFESVDLFGKRLDWLFFHSIFDVLESTQTDWLARGPVERDTFSSSRSQTNKVDYSVLRVSTHFSSVERVFCIGFARFQPSPPLPPAVTTVTADPSRLIYVFARAKLSYFIIARHCSYSRLYRHAIVSAPRWLRVRLGEKNSHDTSEEFYKFLSLSLSRDSVTH